MRLAVPSHVVARPFRFAGTGATAALVQLGLLLALTRFGWSSELAYIAALLLATEVNFVLSNAFTWRDRRSDRLRRRWGLYHASVGAMALVNVIVFTGSSHFIPALEASLLGIAAGAAGNYLMSDRVVFRRNQKM